MVENEKNGIDAIFDCYMKYLDGVDEDVKPLCKRCGEECVIYSKGMCENCFCEEYGIVKKPIVVTKTLEEKKLEKVKQAQLESWKTNKGEMIQLKREQSEKKKKLSEDKIKKTVNKKLKNKRTLPKNGTLAYCIACKEEKMIHRKGMCRSCYNKYGRPEIKCIHCGEMKPHHGRGMCKKCLSEHGKPHKKCVECGEIELIHAKGMCRVCHNRYLRKKNVRACENCGEIKPIRAYDVCNKCHVELYQKRYECKVCGDVLPIIAQDMCDRCYSKHQYSLKHHGVPRDKPETPMHMPRQYGEPKIKIGKLGTSSGTKKIIEKPKKVSIKINPSFKKAKKPIGVCEKCKKKKEIWIFGMCKKCCNQTYDLKL